MEGSLIPLVNLSGERSVVCKLIVKACEEYGFFKVTNHGVSQDIIAEMDHETNSFFAKPMSEKQVQQEGAGPLTTTSTPFGYGCKNIGFNGDVGEIEYLLLDANPLSISQTQSSKDPSKFMSSACAYTEAVKELACEILELMAEGLEVPETSVFSSLIRDIDSDSVLRLNHYSPIVMMLNSNYNSKERDSTPTGTKSLSYTRVGFGEHTDPQILTLLRSNDVGGLQISIHQPVWIPVAPDPAAFFVNVGDLLQVMTNGRFVSVRHRALNNLSKSRISMAYFGAPPLHCCITAPPNLTSPQRPSLYRPFTWAEYKKAAYSLRLGESRLDLFRRSRYDIA